MRHPRHVELAAVFELSPPFVSDTWRASADAPGLRFRVYRTAVLLFNRRHHGRSSFRDDEERILVDHVDALAERLIERGLLARAEWHRALDHEARARAASLLGEDVGDLPELASMRDVSARDLVLGLVPTAQHLAELRSALRGPRHLRAADVG